VRDLEGLLKLQRDLQQPVETVGVARLAAMVAHLGQALHHRARDGGRVIDDDLVA
jgi:tRNA 2-selenouridine synthase SelU